MTKSKPTTVGEDEQSPGQPLGGAPMHPLENLHPSCKMGIDPPLKIFWLYATPFLV